MSITKTFTVTITGGLGAEKYVIDGVQQPTINIVEGGLYKFDVSDSSNTDYGFRFSSTENGTHNSGTVYTTGVSASGTPGNSGAYVQIQLASDAPDPLYYFDINAGTNAGGQINTLEGSSYGTLSWNSNSWGSIAVPQLLTGQSATTSVGAVQAHNIEGWGRQAWGNSGWGVEYSVALSAPATLTSSVGSVTAAQFVTADLTGIGATSSLGSLTLDLTSVTTLTAPSTLTSSVGAVQAHNMEGWGRQEWGNSGWGVEYAVALTGLGATSSVGSVDAKDLLEISLTAPSGLTASLGSLTLDLTSIATLTAPSTLTASVGDFDNAGTLVGWGRNGWGEEPYGDSWNKLVQPSGLSATASVGAVVPADVVGLTGVSATASVGAIAPADVVGLTGVSATASVGAIIPAIGEALSGVSATASVGAIAPADVVGISGLGVTASVGEITVTETQIVALSGVSVTASVGAIAPADVMGLTGVSATASVGAIAPADVMGLTGVSATVSVGNPGQIAWGRVTAAQTGNYSKTTATQTGNWTRVTK